MAVLISKYQELIDGLTKQVEIQEKIISNYKEMVANYDRKIEILEELLARKERENETLAQKFDRISASAAADISVEGTMRDSELSSEGSHT